MKKIIKLTLAVALMLGATSTFAQKLGRINSQELIFVMPETKEMNTKLQALGKELQDNMEALQVEFNQKFTDYQKNLNTYTDSMRQLKEDDLRQMQNRLQEYEQIARQDMQKKQSELFNPIADKASQAINKVAKANGYTVIFDTSAGSMAYFDEATLTDIAPLVRAELGITDADVEAAKKEALAAAQGAQQPVPAAPAK